MDSDVICDIFNDPGCWKTALEFLGIYVGGLALITFALITLVEVAVRLRRLFRILFTMPKSEDNIWSRGRVCPICGDLFGTDWFLQIHRMNEHGLSPDQSRSGSSLRPSPLPVFDEVKGDGHSTFNWAAKALGIVVIGALFAGIIYTEIISGEFEEDQSPAREVRQTPPAAAAPVALATPPATAAPAATAKPANAGVSPCRSAQLQRLDNKTGNPSSGVYAIVPDGFEGRSPIDVYCDMTIDGGGWTLVLNYLHAGGTNPELNVMFNELPIMGDDRLGMDESDDKQNWGHASNALLDSLGFNETMWYCKTSAHQKVIHFKNGADSVIQYLKTGQGRGNRDDWRASEELSLSRGAMLPIQTRNAYGGLGNSAMTETPFFYQGDAHWSVRLEENRWECDGYYPGSFANSTFHQVWIR